jgi:hypothetical protein
MSYKREALWHFALAIAHIQSRAGYVSEDQIQVAITDVLSVIEDRESLSVLLTTTVLKMESLVKVEPSPDAPPKVYILSREENERESVRSIVSVHSTLAGARQEAATKFNVSLDSADSFAIYTERYNGYSTEWVVSIEEKELVE